MTKNKTKHQISYFSHSFWQYLYLWWCPVIQALTKSNFI